jgi:lipopolysaccharide export system protein LptA
VPGLADRIFCKFHAASYAAVMRLLVFASSILLLTRRVVVRGLPVWALTLTLVGGHAQAEKADRNKSFVIEADKPGVLDLQRQTLVFNGNAVISQGSMLLRAERIEMRETADGYRAATAIGSAAKPASWRQRRDGVDETVEGTADRIEFDGRSDTLRFVGNGAVRRLRAGAVADEITGASIVWDNLAEVFRVEGGAATPANPSGRVRVILSPRADTAPPAPASAPLTPSRDLGERR